MINFYLPQNLANLFSLSCVCLQKMTETTQVRFSLNCPHYYYIQCLPSNTNFIYLLVFN